MLFPESSGVDEHHAGVLARPEGGDEAARDVQAAINAARGQLPAGMPAIPTFKKSNPSQAPIMALALTRPISRPDPTI
jgi:multidrug efflux pump subunit AcrB